MRKGICIALALCAALSIPTMARAEEVNYLESFTNGIETLKGNDVSEVVSPEQDFVDSYEPEVMPVVRAPAEEMTLLGYIQSVINKCNTLTNDFGGTSGTRTLWRSAGLFLAYLVVPLAVVLVFFWWGVRKAKNMIVGAFRNGRLSFGPVDRNPNSYYYGTRPSDWR